MRSLANKAKIKASAAGRFPSELRVMVRDMETLIHLPFRIRVLLAGRGKDKGRTSGVNNVCKKYQGLTIPEILVFVELLSNAQRFPRRCGLAVAIGHRDVPKAAFLRIHRDVHVNPAWRTVHNALRFALANPHTRRAVKVFASENHALIEVLAVSRIDDI